jgi:hypothetical protein
VLGPECGPTTVILEAFVRIAPVSTWTPEWSPTTVILEAFVRIAPVSTWTPVVLPYYSDSGSIC